MLSPGKDIKKSYDSHRCRLDINSTASFFSADLFRRRRAKPEVHPTIPKRCSTGIGGVISLPGHFEQSRIDMTIASRILIEIVLMVILCGIEID